MQKKRLTNKIIILLILSIITLLPLTVYADDDIMDVSQNENEILHNEEENQTKKTIVIVGAGISLATFFCTAIFGEKED